MNSQNFDYIQHVRAELFEEYFALTQIIHKYDGYCLQIKLLGVILSFVAIAYGVTAESTLAFFSASVFSISFWMTESFFKVLQQDHLRRLRQLEKELSGENRKNRPHPRIFKALKQQKEINRDQKLWREAMVLEHVMYPHIIFTLFGLIAGNILLWRPFLEY